MLRRLPTRTFLIAAMSWISCVCPDQFGPLVSQQANVVTGSHAKLWVGMAKTPFVTQIIRRCVSMPLDTRGKGKGKGKIRGDEKTRKTITASPVGGLKTCLSVDDSKGSSPTNESRACAADEGIEDKKRLGLRARGGGMALDSASTPHR